MKKLPTYLLTACILLNAGSLFLYSYVNISEMKSDYEKFMINFRLGNATGSAVTFSLLLLILLNVKMSAFGKIACYVLMALSFNTLWNSLFQITESGIFSILLPVTLLVVSFIIWFNDRK